MKRWISGLVGFAASVSWVLAAPPVERSPDGVVVRFPQGPLRLQVWATDCIRVVQAGPSGFGKRKSLAVVGNPKQTSWRLVRTGNRLRVQTKEMAAEVRLDTGTLRFVDRNGKALLADQGLQGRSLKPKTVAGEKAFECRSTFVPSAGESFYGLGTHPEGWFDYAGHTVPLRQDNMRDATPFMVSSRGYGLLWDNTSMSEARFGPNPVPVPKNVLTSLDGRPNGLSAAYFAGQFGKEILRRHDASYSFRKIEDIGGDLPPNMVSARWDGWLNPPISGQYVFQAVSDDGVRLWIDDRKLIDNWKDQPPTERSAKVVLTQGRKARIRLEYYQGGGGAEFQWNWLLPSKTAQHEWWSDFGDQIDYYVICGPGFDKTISRYRQLTGPAPMFAVWAYGLWQCKERYQSSNELISVAATYRSRQIPIDNIIQDWHYWGSQPWGSHAFDKTRFPDIRRTLEVLRNEFNIRTMVSVWGKFEPGSDNYRELEASGALYPPYGDWSGGGARYYDAFSARGRNVYWRQMRDQLADKGFDGWWLDATEPEVDFAKFRTTPTGMGVGARVANAYSLLTTEAVYKGQLALTPNKRPFIMTRSVSAGQQRNGAASWSGDINGDWETFRRQIPAGLSNCMAGLPYWNTDIGGFFSRQPTDPDYRELFVRWMQYGAFTPIFRIHGTGAAKEPWRFGPEAERMIVDTIRLRYSLLPYIYGLAWEVTDKNGTMMRGLPMDFPKDPKVWQIGDQYLFGPSLMVCPVTEPGATSRNVYLPKGRVWFDYWSGKRYGGGQSLKVPAPLDRIPLFAPSGAILPVGPDLQWSTQKPWDPITLRVFPGQDGLFVLYFDDGVSNAYRNGAFATVPVQWQHAKRTLVLGARRGSFAGMRRNQRFAIRVNDGSGTPKVVEYNGSPLKVRL